MDRAEHWEHVYASKRVDEVSWYEAEAQTSLALIAACGLALDAPLIDVGAGASTLADGLVARGYADVTLLDIAGAALEATRRRLPPSASAALHFEVADVTSFCPTRTYALWHDRAVFHFLTEASSRRAYCDVLAAAIPKGGFAVLGTFALEGPERCSGMPIVRYSADSLARELAGILRLIEWREHLHVTPGRATQAFMFGRFERV